MVVASVVGWGLVVNIFADDASWNNWQGYLLGPLGLGGKDGGLGVRQPRRARSPW